MDLNSHQTSGDSLSTTARAGHERRAARHDVIDEHDAFPMCQRTLHGQRVVVIGQARSLLAPSALWYGTHAPKDRGNGRTQAPTHERSANAQRGPHSFWSGQPGARDRHQQGSVAKDLTESAETSGDHSLHHDLDVRSAGFRLKLIAFDVENDVPNADGVGRCGARGIDQPGTTCERLKQGPKAGRQLDRATEPAGRPRS